MVDTDLQIRGGGGLGGGGARSSRPWDKKSGRRSHKNIFSALWASVWSKNTEEGVGAGPSARIASALYSTECISSFVTTKHQQCRLVWVSVFECRFKMFKNFHYCLQRNKYCLCQNVEPIQHSVCGSWAVQWSSFSMSVFIVVVTQVIQALW